MTQYVKNPLILKDKISRYVIVILRTLFLIGLCYLFLFPVIYMFSVAIADPATANDPSSIWIPSRLSLYPFSVSVKILNYFDSAWLTLRIAVFSTMGALLSCSLAGYGLARYNFPGKKIAFAMMFLTIIVPPQVLLTSKYIKFRYFDFGGLLKLFAPLTGVSSVYLLDTSWTFILPSVFACGLRGGLFIFIFKQFFEGMPKELEEAGKIDGCGAFKTFWRIMLPQATPAIITVVLFSFVWHWNDYYSSAVYFSSDIKPLQVMLNGFATALAQGGFKVAGEAISQYEQRMFTQAGALLTVLPPLLTYLAAQKHFTESVERSGIVG